MRRFLIALAFITVATPALAQQAIVAKYRAQYPTPLGTANTLALLRQVAGEVHGGLLVKKDGSNCGGYSCDIVCKSDSELYDVLRDAEGAAAPTWDRTDNPRGYHCELVTPAPPVDEHHADDDDNLRQALAELAPRLSAVEVRLAQLEAKQTPSAGQTPPPPPASDVAADVKRIRELLELVAKRFGLQ